jgi:hypothetical protein
MINESELNESIEIFKKSPGYKWATINQTEEKPKKPLKPKTKKVLSIKPENIKPYRT